MPYKYGVDVRQRRTELIGFLRKNLVHPESYNIFDGYMDVFLEIKGHRQELLGSVFTLMEEKKLQI